MLFSRLRRMQEARLLRRNHIPTREWHALIDGIAVLRGLDAVERVHLQALVLQFLKHKTINGVQGMQIDRRVRLGIAAQACLLILNLDFGYFDGFHEVVVYPGGFRVRQPVTDGSGLVSDQTMGLSGQAWQQGPVILSSEDIRPDMKGAHPGSNVVIHEFAHKLDMLSGSANGAPPLHPDMAPVEWSEALSSAYARLQRQAGRRHPCINPYGASNPAEFFAVISEYFFTAPRHLQQVCPRVYRQLKRYYRQDPGRRAQRATGRRNTLSPSHKGHRHGKKHQDL